MKAFLHPIFTAAIFIFLLTYTVHSQSIRKHWRELTAAERQLYINGLRALYQNNPNIVEEFVSIHNNSTYVRHQHRDFLPWHRSFLYYFEEELKRSGVNAAENIAIPYWNWSTSGDWSSSSPLFHNGLSGSEFNRNGLFGHPIPEGNFIRNFGTSIAQPSAGELVDLVNDFNLFGTASTQQTTHFWPRLERVYHNNYHNFIGGNGGTMSSISRSPRDPIFYLHHSYVDKLWQDWYNIHGSSSIPDQSILINTIPDEPRMARSDLVDSRRLKVWYAENNTVLLDRYVVVESEQYRYTGTVVLSGNTTNTFLVPSGTNCSVISGTSIVLRPGFTAERGSTFQGILDPLSNPNSSFNRLGTEVSAGISDNTLLGKGFEDKIEIFPNPSSGSFNVLLFTGSAPSYTIQIFDNKGKLIGEILKNSPNRAFTIDLDGKPRGVYILKIILNGRVYCKRLVLI